MSVVLPASAALCLYALVEAQGEVLSQEQLMDIGWRHVGFAATENSVRVMISKLRRALAALELDQQITLLAVTRSGYRLIVRDVVPAVPIPFPLPLSLLAPEPQPYRWKRAGLITAGGIAAGVVTALIAQHLFLLTPKKIDFVTWQGEATPADSRVWVPKHKQTQHELIEATLRTYTRYVLGPDQPAAKELYITLGVASSQHHQGVIACQQPLQEANNACESYYFRVN
ncbi:transcriptional regulator [Candidatus Pantoea formicae]|uniref:winged helix-turn-helix domain-containing protein n=1 Tax=Candidatus Pantoea formicae TaxID=2608355 RepID=UPI003EDB6367